MLVTAQKEPRGIFFDLSESFSPANVLNELISGAKRAKLSRAYIQRIKQYYHNPESIVVYKLKNRPLVVIKEDVGMYSIETFPDVVRILNSRFNKVASEYGIESKPQISTGGRDYLNVMIPSLEAVSSVPREEEKERFVKEICKAYGKSKSEAGEMFDVIVTYLETIGKGWAAMPKGWTEESVKSFWKSLTGDRKHKVTKCIKEMTGKVDDPGAFCASLADMVDPGWRSK